MGKILITATVQSHIAQFHKPLINMLKETGYEVHIAAKDNLTEKNGLKLNEVDKTFDVQFNRSPFSKENFIAYRELKKIINNGEYDFIHCNTPVGGVVTRLAAKKSRKKGSRVFYTVHGFHFYRGASILNWVIYYPIEKFFARYTDKLITITEEDYNLAKKKMKTNVVHMHGVGANSERFFPYSEKEIFKLKEKHGILQDELLILCIGELNKNKNQSTIIKSLVLAKKKIPKIKLLLAGNGPMEKELKELVTELDLEENVIFLGYVTNLEEYINLSDVVVSLSYREGLPLNIMEAMLCGKPVIVSKNRGHNELVKNGQNGFVLEPNDWIKLSSLLIRLSSESELKFRLGSVGVEFIKKFTTNNIIKELNNIYTIR